MDDKKLNLYKIKIDHNNREKYIVDVDMVSALMGAQNKYGYDILGIWLIEENVK
jgi:hypothetical protein